MAPESATMSFSRALGLEVAGLRLRVLSLETVIESKEATGGDKDKAMLPVLRRTLEEKKKSESRKT